MGRPPEVSDSEIIEAGKALARRGKSPNPGAIRVELGGTGGLMRIKHVWTTYCEKHGTSFCESSNDNILYQDIPTELIEQTDSLIEKVDDALKLVVTDIYSEMLKRSEQRHRAQEKEFNQKLEYYSEYEVSADQSIQNLEQELENLQAEMHTLADQNAKLLIENATLNGRLDEMDRHFANNGAKGKTNASKAS